jgi:3-phenylpropionate/trans-cinnamate dioxygenase ferredoxin subunit
VSHVRYLRVASVGDMEGKQVLGAEVDGSKIMIVKTSQGLRALDAICTHEYADLTRGIISGDTVICPLHFSRFNLITGEVETPPADAPLRVYPVKVEGNEIYVGV